MKQTETKTDEKGTKRDEIFVCKLCDYSTCHSGHWKRHIVTKKHKKLEMKQNETSETKADEKGTKGTKRQKYHEYCCDKCGEPFGSRTTLWRHKKKCVGVSDTTVTTIFANPIALFSFVCNKSAIVNCSFLAKS